MEQNITKHLNADTSSVATGISHEVFIILHNDLDHSKDEIKDGWTEPEKKAFLEEIKKDFRLDFFPTFGEFTDVAKFKENLTKYIENKKEECYKKHAEQQAEAFVKFLQEDISVKEIGKLMQGWQDVKIDVADDVLKQLSGVLYSVQEAIDNPGESPLYPTSLEELDKTFSSHLESFDINKSKAVIIKHLEEIKQIVNKEIGNIIPTEQEIESVAKKKRYEKINEEIQHIINSINDAMDFHEIYGKIRLVETINLALCGEKITGHGVTASTLNDEIKKLAISMLLQKHHPEIKKAKEEGISQEFVKVSLLKCRETFKLDVLLLKQYSKQLDSIITEGKWMSWTKKAANFADLYGGDKEVSIFLNKCAGLGVSVQQSTSLEIELHNKVANCFGENFNKVVDFPEKIQKTVWEESVKTLYIFAEEIIAREQLEKLLALTEQFETYITRLAASAEIDNPEISQLKTKLQEDILASPALTKEIVENFSEFITKKTKRLLNVDIVQVTDSLGLVTVLGDIERAHIRQIEAAERKSIELAGMLSRTNILIKDTQKDLEKGILDSFPETMRQLNNDFPHVVDNIFCFLK